MKIQVPTCNKDLWPFLRKVNYLSISNLPGMIIAFIILILQLLRDED
jgi:hypothetical protein